MKLLKYIQLFLLVFFIASCEKEPISDTSTPDDTSTLDENLNGKHFCNQKTEILSCNLLLRKDDYTKLFAV